MIQFKENARTDGRTGRPYFIGPFRLPPGLNKLLETILNISNKAVHPNPLPIPKLPLEDDSIRTNLREKRSKYEKSIIQVTIRKILSKK